MSIINSLAEKIRSILSAGRRQARATDTRTQLMLDATPLCVNVLDRDYRAIECNQESVNLFELRDKQEYIEKFWKLQPEYQPDGSNSMEKMKEITDKAYAEGYCRFEWMHRKINGEAIPCEVTLVRVEYNDDYIVLSYMRDLREHKQMISEIKKLDDLLHTVNRAAVAMLSIEDDEKFEDSFISGMELIGRCLEVDRVQIWQNEVIDKELNFVHKYEWLSNLGCHSAPVPIGIKFPYKGNVEWLDMFLRGEYINTPVSQMSQTDQDFLRSYEIQSIVIIPLFLNDQFWGFFSIDDCRRERTFTDEEINILRSASLMMASAVNRHRQVGEMFQAENDLRLARDAAETANQAKSIFIANMSH